MTEETSNTQIEATANNSLPETTEIKPDSPPREIELAHHDYTITDFNPKTDLATIYFKDANTTTSVQIPRLPNGHLIEGEQLDEFISSLIPVRLDTVQKKDPAPNANSIMSRVKYAPEPDFSTSVPDPMTVFKEQRKLILDQSDWTQIPDNSLSKEKREEWRKYRQALRDIPQRYAKADLTKVKIEYPTPPAE